ncbi:MAG TPA: carboxylesterase family protein [Pseudonocardiaceae bacterium]|jgi:para-nitrobenzyl esterase|nr:carboxylesterase family protein [Pseudonocardiaceae bacterium]
MSRRGNLAWRGWLGIGLAAATIVAGVSTAGLSTAEASGTTGTVRAPVTSTTDGLVRGSDTQGVDEFLGIPYAAPPVGTLRWQPPQPAARWSGVREATAFAPHCAQPASTFGTASTSEDCLYLNVYAPAGSTRSLAGRPVMVWIHGGAFVYGESDNYDPSALVRAGAVVVSINYRLGAFGFLADSALADHGASGNYGLMDQQVALRWVRANIGRFGGNPGNVTLWGESAGGLSVLSQLASPGARGLFDKAIVESGAYDLNPQSLTDAETSGTAFATKLGCDTGTSAQIAACLRTVPTAQIVSAEPLAGYRPDIDGTVLTRSLQQSFATGQFNRVPILNGSNRDEYRLFVAEDALGGAPLTPAAYPTMVGTIPSVPTGDVAAAVSEYPLSDYPSPALALGAVGTDSEFACTALTVDQLVSHCVPTYGYEFTDEQAPELFLPPQSFPYGAAHESEVQYLFSYTDAPFPASLSTQQQGLAASMRTSWLAFARNARPSTTAAAQWPRFTDNTERLRTLDPQQSGVETNFATTHNCGFWAGLGS